MNKFSLFLVIALGLSGGLATYFVIEEGVLINSNSQTGTLLDRFDLADELKTGDDSDEINKITALTDREVVSPTNSYDKNSIIFFEKNTGKVYEVDLNTKIEKLVSDKFLPNFISAKWSPDKKKSLNSYIEGDRIIFKHYDPLTSKEVPLEKSIRSAAFSPDSRYLAFYNFNDPGQESTDDPLIITAGRVGVLDPESTYQKKVIDTRLENLEVNWPILDKISFKTDLNDVFLLTEDGKLNKVLNQKQGLELKWSPSGNKILFSADEIVNDNLIPLLWVKDIATGTEIALDYSGKASLCDWSIDDVTIYCALKKSPSVDELYRIDTFSNSKDLIAEPGTLIKELFLSGLESHLIMVTVAENKLYTIKISP